MRGANVVIIADNDEVGRDHADTVARELHGIATSVMVRLPAHGNDLTDHIDAGGQFDDLQPLDPNELADDHRARIRQAMPAINWHELWADDSEEEWILEPLLPARRLVALYSAPKVGKSLLMLELAVGISRGTETLGVTPPRAFTVLYVDFENDPKGDIRSRLQAMGHGPDDLSNLHYLSFPTLAALDSAAGSEQLLDAIDAYGAEVVVIDTVSRAVKGEENENDTWLAFYRHTGLALKQAQVAMIRLDHSGKDETKGQRGGSAKSGDVDAIWRLSKVDDTTFELVCDAARIPIDEKQIVLKRETIPNLRHKVDADGVATVMKAKFSELLAWLDAHNVPPDLGVNKTMELLRKHGRGRRKDLVSEVQEHRKNRIGEWRQQP
jgi:KaiC/GvpD/RAD55 family RecA-like ATPase